MYKYKLIKDKERVPCYILSMIALLLLFVSCADPYELEKGDVKNSHHSTVQHSISREICSDFMVNMITIDLILKKMLLFGFMI